MANFRYTNKAYIARHSNEGAKRLTQGHVERRDGDVRAFYLSIVYIRLFTTNKGALRNVYDPSYLTATCKFYARPLQNFQERPSVLQVAVKGVSIVLSNFHHLTPTYYSSYLGLGLSLMHKSGG